MAKRRHLAHAPIREAIIDIGVVPPVGFDDLRKFAESLRKDFPKIDAMKERAFGFEIREDAFTTSTVDRGFQGIRLRSKDERHVLQARLGGFTFSRLPPYETWESLSATTKPLWDSYCAVANPQTVRRLGLRYVNVIELPLHPALNFEEYFTASPSVPNELPQQIGSYFSRTLVVDSARKLAAFLTQSFEPTAGETAPIILDIDTFAECTHIPNGNEMWDLFGKLRDFKNEIFFSSITEKAARLFE